MLLAACRACRYDPSVATYETTLIIPCVLDEAFAFVSDFRNAALWDPRTYAVEKATPGPIGVGTRFMLTGGMLTKHLVRRLHIPESVAGMPLPYDVVRFEPPHEFVLEGESPVFRYRDLLEFSPTDGGACTELRYSAELMLKGLMAVGEPFLRIMFRRIGDDATRDLPATVARGI
jgi:hypothetical protein